MSPTMRGMPVSKISTGFYVGDPDDSIKIIPCGFFEGCDGYDTSFCGGLNMGLFWNIFFWLIPIWTFILIPFATFYYEADDGMLMAGTSVSPNSSLYFTRNS